MHILQARLPCQHSAGLAFLIIVLIVTDSACRRTSIDMLARPAAQMARIDFVSSRRPGVVWHPLSSTASHGRRGRRTGCWSQHKTSTEDCQDRVVLK